MFKKPLSEITHQDILTFIDVDEFETTTTDAKKQWAFEKVLRDITEFANTYGGIVLVGVDEDKKAIKPEPRFKSLGVPYSPKDREKLENMVLTLTYPPVPFEIGKVDVPGAGDNCIWVIRVRESQDAPHEVRLGGDHYLPCRFGTRGRNLSLAEIKAMLARQQSFGGAQLDLLGPRVEGNGPTLELAARPLRPRISPILRPEDEKQFLMQVTPRFFARTAKSEDLVSARAVELGIVEMNARDPGWLHFRLDNMGMASFSHQATESLGPKLDIMYLIGRTAEFIAIYQGFLIATGQWASSVLQVRLSPPAKVERRGVPEAQKELIVESPTRARRPDWGFWVDLTLPLGFDQPAWHTVRDVVVGIIREHGHLPNEGLLNANVRFNCQNIGLDKPPASDER